MEFHLANCVGEKTRNFVFGSVLTYLNMVTKFSEIPTFGFLGIKYEINQWIYEFLNPKQIEDDII